jgi:hypothetical protein
MYLSFGFEAPPFRAPRFDFHLIIICSGVESVVFLYSFSLVISDLINCGVFCCRMEEVIA